MDELFVVSLVYPDSEPVKFLLFTLGVITFGIWRGIKEDGYK